LMLFTLRLAERLASTIIADQRPLVATAAALSEAAA
jgi:hypothetical protein